LLPLLRGAGPMALMLWLDGMMMMMVSIHVMAVLILQVLGFQVRAL
jgi:hypothetical protein